jgi:hypothetical protein
MNLLRIAKIIKPTQLRGFFLFHSVSNGFVEAQLTLSTQVSTSDFNGLWQLRNKSKPY